MIEVCVGNDLQLNVQPNGGGGITATGYAWSSSNGLTSNQQNPTINNVTEEHQGLYTVTVTYSNGCTSTATTGVSVSSGSASIDVFGETTVCEGGATILIASGGSSYLWLTGATTNLLQVNQSGTYTVTVTNVSNCTATDAISINFVPCCQADAGYLSVNDTICPGEPILATATSYNQTAGYGFYYLLADENGMIVDVSTNGTFDNSYLPGSYTLYGYSVKTSAPVGGPAPPAVGTNVGGIIGNCYTLSESPMNIVVPELMTLPEVIYNSGEGTSGTGPFAYNEMIIEISGGAVPYNFDWETEGYVRADVYYNADSSGAVIYIYYVDGATWEFTMTDSNGCTDDELVVNNTPTGSNEVLDIDSYEVTEAEEGEPTGSITLEVSGGDFTCGEYQYFWEGSATWAGDFIPTDDGSYVLTGLPTGWYVLTVTDCAGNTSVGWYWVGEDRRGRTKAEDLIAALEVRPNPFSTLTHIFFQATANDHLTATVYSIEGKRVATLMDDQVDGGQTYHLSFNAESLPVGVYFLQLKTASGETQARKLVVTR